MINLGAEFGTHLESSDDAIELIDIRVVMGAADEACNP